MAKLTIIKSNGFKVVNGKETEHEAVSLKRFLEIITAEPEIIEAYRNKEIEVEDESLSMAESDKIIAALDAALAEEIFSEEIFNDDDY
jgi:hypothetical protein